MPLTVKERKSASETKVSQLENDVANRRTVFVYKPDWFALSQTDGEPYSPVAMPEWNETTAIASLNIERIPFTMIDGNCQGYASHRRVAVSPIAYLPHRTLFHEIAHVLLHTGDEPEFLDGGERTPRDIREVEAEAVVYIVCQSLGLPGEAFSRGYLQHWLGQQQITAKSAQRIFHAADLILKSGRPTAPSA